ncbi:MAG: hypothetical protein WCC03_10785 [Candidatus Acidiferrales bacterium]
MMVKILAMAVTVLVSIVAAGVCQAQSRPLEVNVPFAFEVGNKTMPAGSYHVESIPTGGGSLEILRNTGSGVHLTISTMATALRSGTPGPALVFHRYGNRYFLSQIRTGDRHAREVFPSQREKELARLEPSVEVALLGPAPAGKP